MGINYNHGDREKVCIELIQNMVNRIEVMCTLLYEVKAGTPLGKVVVVLLNLQYLDNDNNFYEEINISNISFSTLAAVAGVNTIQLQESLDYLQKQGIISYNKKD